MTDRKHDRSGLPPLARVKEQRLNARHPKKRRLILGKGCLVGTERTNGSPAYDPSFAVLALRLYLFGFNDEKVAATIGVSIQCLYNWQKRFPELKQATHDGKVGVSADIVYAITERARGYSHPEVKVFYDRETGECVEHVVTKHIPPDVAAAELILTNRHPELWKRRNTVELQGPDGSMLPAPTFVIQPVVSINSTGNTAVQVNVGDD